jgi:hypothetical protein
MSDLVHVTTVLRAVSSFIEVGVLALILWGVVRLLRLTSPSPPVTPARHEPRRRILVLRVQEGIELDDDALDEANEVLRLLTTGERDHAVLMPGVKLGWVLESDKAD